MELRHVASDLLKICNTMTRLVLSLPNACQRGFDKWNNDKEFLRRPKRHHKNYPTLVACLRLWHSGTNPTCCCFALRRYLRAQSLHRRDSGKFHNSTNSIGTKSDFICHDANGCILPSQPIFLLLIFPSFNIKSHTLTTNVHGTRPANRVQFNGLHYDCWRMNKRRWTDSALWNDT